MAHEGTQSWSSGERDHRPHSRFLFQENGPEVGSTVHAIAVPPSRAAAARHATTPAHCSAPSALTVTILLASSMLLTLNPNECSNVVF
jgi:hypothetical protein